MWGPIFILLSALFWSLQTPEYLEFVCKLITSLCGTIAQAKCSFPLSVRTFTEWKCYCFMLNILHEPLWISGFILYPSLLNDSWFSHGDISVTHESTEVADFTESVPVFLQTAGWEQECSPSPRRTRCNVTAEYTLYSARNMLWKPKRANVIKIPP